MIVFQQHIPVFEIDSWRKIEEKLTKAPCNSIKSNSDEFSALLIKKSSCR